MSNDLQEQACWLALVFESKLSLNTVNSILVTWCKQLGRTLQEFFAADTQAWSATCYLKSDSIQKLEQAKEKLVGQIFLAEQLQHTHIHMTTVLDSTYPRTLKAALTRSRIPPILFYMGNLDILARQTIALIGSRNASETSLNFTRDAANYLSVHGANVISGYARGVDRAAYEGAMNTRGCTTVVLPQGIRKLSKVQMQELQTKTDAGTALLISQFHPDAPWLVSRAMERNQVVTGLAHVVIVAESDVKGGTWEGAQGALKQRRIVYVRQSESETLLPGNTLLLEHGAKPLRWPARNADDAFAHLLQKSEEVQARQLHSAIMPDQLSLLASPNE